jgi:T5SS/PEP-CTERM-associated repeat protein
LQNRATGTLSGELTVGKDNYGELVIESQATLSVGNLISSYASATPASSRVIVTGGSSRLIVTDPGLALQQPLLVGATGPGELMISAGGQVQVQQGGAWLACCEEGNPPHFGSGGIVVEGQNSRLEAKHFGWFAVGGPSYVNIRDRGVIHATDTSYFSHISSNSPYTIQVDVSDPNSLLQIDAGLEVGGWLSGSARLSIRNGGRAQVAGDVWIGNGLEATYVGVDGGDALAATMQVGGALYVGGSDQGAGSGASKLNVSNNGQVVAGSMKVWQPGTVELDGGIVSTGSLELAGGLLAGTGTISVDGQFTNAGTVAPGLSAGVLTVSSNFFYGGNYVQEPAGKLAIEIGGTNSAEFDRLIIADGSATLHGTLAVSLIDPLGGTSPFQPSAGDSFKFLTAAAGGLGTATFDNYVLPRLPGGLYMGALFNYDDASVSLVVAGVLGDYNRNGVVDAADYVVWRDTLGQAGGTFAADGDRDGSVDPDDYQVWKTHFGMHDPYVGARSLLADAARAIPEPATWWSLLLAMCCLGAARRAKSANPAIDNLHRTANRR